MPTLFTMLFIIAAIALVAYGMWYNSPSQKGKRGELRVHEILSHLPSDYHVLDDVVLQTSRGTTQIDHVVISKYGVFAIETKNYRGEIYGDDSREQWTQIIVTKVKFFSTFWKTYNYVTKNHFYNPVKQSLAHLYEIKNNLYEWPQLKIIPIVVFTGNADLRHVQTNNIVVYDYNLIDAIQKFRTAYITDSELQDVVFRLSAMNIRVIVDNKTHVRNIKAAKKEQESKLKAGICPRCGGNLVLRNGKYGKFYGCSNYPKCTFITH